MDKNIKQPTPQEMVAISIALHQMQSERSRSTSTTPFTGFGGQPARSPWSSKILTLRKLPGQY